MSTTVDSRVVEMRFDNKQFEQGVSTTMSTLDKLRQALRLPAATKGFQEVDKAAKGLNLAGLGTAVETVQAKFSALGVVGVTALANITNSAMNTAKRMVSALTIDPIKTGLEEYETKINAVQTILANTSSKGTTMDDVTKTLGELNTYADKTIYNFAEMTRNIGTFTAAGVGLEESATAIQGIANLAAVSGSNSQQASTAMYQLSQAMAAGTVKLMDWNSVVNAGMGGQVFQDALKETARTHGVAVDDIIKKNGSFRESLQEGWITTEILTETLAKMTKGGAAEYLAKLTGVEQKQIETAQKLVAENKDGSASYEELATKLAATGKISKDKAIEILKMADTAEDAATKVKTFTQLWDTLKESAQSGWSQTWEILIGDFEEAKETLTSISEVIGNVINKSAEARNNLLQGWKDAGGRADVVASLFNVIEAIGAFVKPIKEAFREIFPPMTVQQLVDFTKKLKEFTAKLKISDGTAARLKSTFRGIFAAVSIVIDVIKTVAGGIVSLIKHFSGAEQSVLGLTASFGDWLTNLRTSIKEGNVFGKAIDKITGFIGSLIDKLKAFGSAARESFQTKGLGGFGDFLKGIWNTIQKIGSKLREAFSGVGEGLADIFSGDSNVFNFINNGLFAGILAGIMKFTNGLGNTFKGVEGFLENVTGILEDVRGCFEAYQQNLKAGTLMKIAGAIAILAAAILVISTIDPGELAASLGAITVLFGELLGSLAIFNKLSPTMKGAGKSAILMIGMSTAILILAGALKKMSGIPVVDMIQGLIGIGVMMKMLSSFLNNAKFSGKVTSTAFGLILLGTALMVMSKAVEMFGGIPFETMGKGLLGIAGSLLIVTTAMKFMPKNMVGTGVGLIAVAGALVILSSALDSMGEMTKKEIGKSLLTLAGALGAITLALNFMPKNMVSIGLGMIGVSAAILILSKALEAMGNMSKKEIGKSLIALAGSLLMLTTAMIFMSQGLVGAAAMLVMTAALAAFTPVLMALGSMSLTQIGTGLLALAGAFAVVGVAGLVLGPLVPIILGLSAVIALLGVGCAAVGVGVLAFSAGMAALAVSGVAGAAALTNIIVSIIGLIPAAATALAQGIITFAATIAAGAPVIAQAVIAVGAAVITAATALTPPLLQCLGVLLDALLRFIVEYVPKIVVAGVQLIVGLLDGIAQNLPAVIDSAVNVISKFLIGIGKAVPRVVDAGFKMIIEFINGMANSIRNNTDTMISAVNNLMSAVLSAIKKWFKNLVSNGAKIVKELVSGVKSKFSEMKSAAGDMMDGFIKGVKEKFSSIKKAAVNAIKGAVDGVKSFLGIKSPSRVFAEIGRYSDEGFAQGLKKYSNVAGDAAVGLGNTVLNGIRECLGIHSPATTGIELGEYFVQGFAEGITADMSAEEAASQKAQNIANAFKKELDKIETDVSTADLEYELWSRTAGMNATDEEWNAAELARLTKNLQFQNDKVAIADAEYKRTLMAFGENSEHTQAAYNKLLQQKISLVDLSSQITDLQKSMVEGDNSAATFNAYSEWLKKNASNLEKYGMSMAKIDEMARRETGYNPDGVVANTAAVVTNVGVTYGEAMDSGIQSTTNLAVTSASTMVTSCVDKIKALQPEWISGGAHLVEGFIKGIEDNIQPAANKAAEMAMKAHRAAMAVLGINSPSKAFAEIGKFADLGFAKGLSDYADRAAKASGDMAGGALSSLENVTSQMTKTISRGIGAQPTITPVFDLSRLQNGVSQLNGLVAHRSADLAANASVAISAQTNIHDVIEQMQKINDSRDSEIVGALGELRGDFGNLINAIANLGIQLDDGTMVGRIINKIDTGLGRIATHKGRGN